MKTQLKNKHYNLDYFEWQKSSGGFGGKADLFKFKNFIKKSDNVLDFGSGGGYLLKNIQCKDKLGIEINKFARKTSEENGVKAVSSIENTPDGWADAIISNHALEHVLNPYETLIKLKKKLKNGGRAIFVVPFEVKNSYKNDDINMHLYTWSPQNLGNLFKVAGYKIVSVDQINHLWPPFYSIIYKLFGQKIFDVICRIYCRLYGKMYQVRVVAQKV